VTPTPTSTPTSTPTATGNSTANSTPTATGNSTPTPTPTAPPPPPACPPATAWNGTWCLDPAVERAAAAHYARVDADIRAHFAPERPGYEYAGPVAEVIGSDGKTGRYGQDVLDAYGHDLALGKVAGSFDESPGWRAVALARQGTLYDALWSALHDAGPPKIVLFTPQQLMLLHRITSPYGVQGVQSQVNDLRVLVQAAWDQKKDALLADAAKQAITRYAASLALATTYRVSTPQTAHAHDRLVALTRAVGEDRVREIVTHTPDPRDASGRTMLTYTDGMYSAPPP